MDYIGPSIGQDKPTKTNYVGVKPRKGDRVYVIAEDYEGIIHRIVPRTIWKNGHEINYNRYEVMPMFWVNKTTKTFNKTELYRTQSAWKEPEPVTLIHHHMLLSGVVQNVPKNDIDRIPPFATKVVEDWLTELVNKIKMKILIPAKAEYCFTKGNEGVTGIVCLETSHASVHFWNRDNSFKFDLYSCAEFSTDQVLNHFEPFGLTYYQMLLVDRDNCIVLNEKSLGK
jgi:S-adenosylmethionine/arginine decarboxylase-like enzyme